MAMTASVKDKLARLEVTKSCCRRLRYPRCFGSGAACTS